MQSFVTGSILNKYWNITGTKSNKNGQGENMAVKKLCLHINGKSLKFHKKKKTWKVCHLEKQDESHEHTRTVQTERKQPIYTLFWLTEASYDWLCRHTQFSCSRWIDKILGA